MPARLKLPDTSPLSDPEHPINDLFFDTLSDLQTVRGNSKLLLSLEPHESSRACAIDVLHDTANLLETAYEHLYVWTKHQCQLLANNLTPDVPLPDRAVSAEVATESLAVVSADSNKLLQRALGVLRERPVYFSYSLKDISKARREAAVKTFNQTLCQGGVNSKPIELRSYDPVRYAADMLAWIHQSIAAELEFAESLFISDTEGVAGGQVTTSLSSTADGTSEMDVLEDQQGIDESKLMNEGAAVEELLNFVLEGLVPILESRMNQILTPRLTFQQLHRLAQLIDFYAITLSLTHKSSRSLVSRSLLSYNDACSMTQPSYPNSGSLKSPESSSAPPPSAPIEASPSSPHSSSFVSQDSPLLACLRSLDQSTARLFKLQWDSKASEIASLPTSSVLTADLSAPGAIVEVSHIISDILDLCNHSLLPSPCTLAAPSPLHFDLTESLVPIIDGCREVALSLPPAEASIYIINCLSTLQLPLTYYPFTAETVQYLAGRIDDHMSRLVSTFSAMLLEGFGFTHRLTNLRRLGSAGQFREADKEEDGDVATTVQKRRGERIHPCQLDESLSTPSMTSCFSAFYVCLFTHGTLPLPLADRLSSRIYRLECRQAVGREIASAYQELFEAVSAALEDEAGMCNTGREGGEGDATVLHTPEEIRTLLDI
eukprot:GHVQ01021833.1.p1 GENE.GHVQ01021833.1~~GHVQ01021833.1.p1  ORF type:complete len:660 (-),score=74.19 GHVQ01021833.1:3723-5702(-)